MADLVRGLRDHGPDGFGSKQWSDASRDSDTTTDDVTLELEEDGDGWFLIAGEG